MVEAVLRGNMQIGDLVQIVSRCEQLRIIGVYLGSTYHSDLFCKFMYDGGKVADFDLRFWKINVIA